MESNLVEAQAKEISLAQTPQEQIEFAEKAAGALMAVINKTKPLDFNGKKYLYFEHWQTIAKFFSSSVGVTDTIKDVNGYIAKAVVYNSQGVIIGGAEASCMKDEVNWKNKPDYQLRSMAQTRAMAKALRSIYGFVAVLAGAEATPAEEMHEVKARGEIANTNKTNYQPKAVSNSDWDKTEQGVIGDKCVIHGKMIQESKYGAVAYCAAKDPKDRWCTGRKWKTQQALPVIDINEEAPLPDEEPPF